jgi:hypothetical protein
MHWLKSQVFGLYYKTYHLRSVARLRLLLQNLERAYQRDRVQGLQELMLAELQPRKVLSGPFQGMIYPRDMTLGSAYFPKLVGTYEKEIGEHLERLLRAKTYETIVDVGSAEGFYAVGLALRNPAATIHAYDIDKDAQGCMTELASINGVTDRIEFRSECTPADLERHAERSPRGLLISDCEGYEFELFQPHVLKKLAGWDLLIETHDSLEQDITRPLSRRISKTHRVRLLRWRRRTLKDYPRPEVANPLGPLSAMDEGRTWRNKWLVCEAKKT